MPSESVAVSAPPFPMHLLLLLNCFMVSAERKSPEKIGLAETSIFVTNAVLHCSQFQSKQREEHRVNRVISKLQHFANKDVSEIKPTKPVQVGG